ncbi:hypothetical protein [Pseudomonas sp. YJ42]|uniref:hypothetical protein n=1 Tax=Pseudomonas sp. YJ42 TaxID=3392115 RepID=UPI0039A11C42
MPPTKSTPTTERAWSAKRHYIPAERLQAQREHLGWQLLTNYVVRNADCHSKNIALFYTSRADAALTQSMALSLPTLRQQPLACPAAGDLAD